MIISKKDQDYVLQREDIEEKAAYHALSLLKKGVEVVVVQLKEDPESCLVFTKESEDFFNKEGGGVGHRMDTGHTVYISITELVKDAYL